MACLFAVTAGTAAAQSGPGDPGALTPCVTCGSECTLGSGWACQEDAKGTKGGTSCSADVIWSDDPLDEGGGDFICLCAPAGEICALRQTFAPTDRETLGREASEVVASGGMLPADGLFFVAFRAGERIVRWKCDGGIAGRVATAADIPTGTRPLAG